MKRREYAIDGVRFEVQVSREKNTKEAAVLFVRALTVDGKPVLDNYTSVLEVDHEAVSNQSS